MAKPDIFDKKILLAFIGRRFRKLMGDMTQHELAKKTDMAQSFINALLSGDSPASRDKLWEVASKGLGMRESAFKDLLVEAKVYEIETTSGKELDSKSVEDIIAEEFDVNDPEDIKKIIDVITMMTKK